MPAWKVDIEWWYKFWQWVRKLNDKIVSNWNYLHYLIAIFPLILLFKFFWDLYKIKNYYYEFQIQDDVQIWDKEVSKTKGKDRHMFLFPDKILITKKKKPESMTDAPSFAFKSLIDVSILIHYFKYLFTVFLLVINFCL